MPINEFSPTIQVVKDSDRTSEQQCSIQEGQPYELKSPDQSVGASQSEECKSSVLTSAEADQRLHQAARILATGAIRAALKKRALQAESDSQKTTRQKASAKKAQQLDVTIPDIALGQSATATQIPKRCGVPKAPDSTQTAQVTP